MSHHSEDSHSLTSNPSPPDNPIDPIDPNNRINIFDVDDRPVWSSFPVSNQGTYKNQGAGGSSFNGVQG